MASKPSLSSDLNETKNFRKGKSLELLEPKIGFGFGEFKFVTCVDSALFSEVKDYYKPGKALVFSFLRFVFTEFEKSIGSRGKTII